MILFSRQSFTSGANEAHSGTDSNNAGSHFITTNPPSSVQNTGSGHVGGSGSSISVGSYVGIGVGIFLSFLLIVFFILFFLRRRNLKKKNEKYMQGNFIDRSMYRGTVEQQPAPAYQRSPDFHYQSPSVPPPAYV